MNKEIVIAAYNRDLSWLDKFNGDVKKTIYRKGVSTNNPNEIFLENNVGRDVHTFFYHIYENYDNLSDITFFGQEFPFDHWEDIVDVINNDAWVERCALQIKGYFGFHFNTIKVHGANGGLMWDMQNTTHHDKGKIITCNADGTPQAALGTYKISINTSWYEFFDCDTPNIYEFMPGGHFGVTREHVHLRSRDFYKSVVDLLTNDVDSPWVIERLECYFFNPKYKSKM